MSVALSVCMLTYNHEGFIAQAIDNVLMQKTNFPIEIIIAEDCSTDGTRAIIREYEKKYPEIIKPIYHENNVGAIRNARDFAIPQCRGKYIALCEGDDYWTDVDKLQKQVDFLENNSDYTFCCHRFQVYNEQTKKWDDDAPNNFRAKLFEGLDYIDIDLVMQFKIWLTQPLTTVFRRDALDMIEIQKYQYFRDVHLFFLLLREGKGRCLNMVAAVYRQHTGGAYSNINAQKRMLDAINVQGELYRNNQNFEILRKVYLKSIEKYLSRFRGHAVNLKSEYKLLSRAQFPMMRLLLKKYFYLIKGFYRNIK